MIPNPTNATRMRTSPWFERTAQKRHVFGLDMTSTIKVKQSPENDGAILHRTLKRAGRHDPMQCENSVVYQFELRHYQRRSIANGPTTSSTTDSSPQPDRRRIAQNFRQ